MKKLLTIGISMLVTGLLGAQQVTEDPVAQARAQRAANQGIREGDLPPVPRTLVEPPPLPPPETHRKDLPGGSVRPTPKIKAPRLSARRKANPEGRARLRGARVQREGAPKLQSRTKAAPRLKAAPKTKTTKAPQRRARKRR